MAIRGKSVDHGCMGVYFFSTKNSNKKAGIAPTCLGRRDSATINFAPQSRPVITEKLPELH